MDLIFQPIPSDVLAAARRDDRVRVTATGGEPVRCCLRDADAGEELLLFRYEPPLAEGSPYQETGAVFVHRSCQGTSASADYPEGWAHRSQVLRAYDDRGWIHDARTVADGHESQQVLAELFADPAVVQVDSRNIAYGCWMFRVVSS